MALYEIPNKKECSAFGFGIDMLRSDDFDLRHLHLSSATTATQTVWGGKGLGLRGSGIQGFPKRGDLKVDNGQYPPL